MPLPHKLSIKKCEQVLKTLIKITTPDDRRVNFNQLVNNFQETDKDQLHESLEILKNMGCVTLKSSTANYGFDKILSITVLDYGVAYFVDKKHKRNLRYIELLLSYILGILTPLTVYFITEYVLPLISK